MRRKIYLGLGATLTMVLIAIIIGNRFGTDEIEVYRKPTYQIPDSWTPVKSLSTAENAIATLAYEGLFTINRFLEIVPQLVDSWQLDPTGLTYTFKLKKNVRFHNGTLFTSQHVVEMFRKLMAPGSPVHMRYQRIKQVVPFDSDTVKVELKSAYPPFISLLAAPAARIALEQDALNYPHGTGAFKVVELQKQDNQKTLVLHRFEDYYGKKPKIRILELVEADQKQVLDGVQNGRFHDSVIYPYFEIKPDSLSNSDAVRKITQGTTTWVLALNNGKGPTADLHLRRCLAQSFDRKNFVDRFIPEHQPALGIIPPTLMGSGQIKPSDSPSTNCRGLGNIELNLIYPEVLERGAEMCAAFTADFGKIGVRAQCQGLPFDQLLQKITNKTFNIAFLAQTLDLPDVEYFLEAFESNAPYNLSNYHSLTLDRALSKARQEPDRAKRASLFTEIDRELFKNVATINISYPPHISYWNRCLEGVELSLAGESYVDYTAIHRKRGCRMKAEGKVHD